MAEFASAILGIAATGLHLSKELIQYADSVSTAPMRIQNISANIELTSNAIRSFSTIFSDERRLRRNLITSEQIETAKLAIAQSSKIFEEIRHALERIQGKSMLGKWLFPFKESNLAVLENDLQSLKTSLDMIVNMMTCA